MTDTRQYIFTPTMGPPHAYDLDETGLVYHPPGAPEVALGWKDIQYLEERAGQRVDIITADPDLVVPLYFGTREFADLLGRLCAKLAGLHRAQMETLTFRASRSYFTHFSVVIGVLIVFFMAGVLFLNFFDPGMLLVLVMTLPISIHLILQPIEVTPSPQGLHVRDFCRRRLIPYGAIENLTFDARGDLHVSFLRVLLILRNGRRIKISRFDNLILLFILIEHYWRHRPPKPEPLRE